MIDGLSSNGKRKKGPQNHGSVSLRASFVVNRSPFEDSFKVVRLDSFMLHLGMGNHAVWIIWFSRPRFEYFIPIIRVVEREFDPVAPDISQFRPSSIKNLAPPGINHGEIARAESAITHFHQKSSFAVTHFYWPQRHHPHVFGAY